MGALHLRRRRLDLSADHSHPLADQFRAFIEHPDFPCVGAKAALSRERLTIVIARDILSAWDDLRIYTALFDFTSAYRADRQLFQSFAVIFANGEPLSEARFEQALWDRLQSLADKDVWHGQPYDERVSPDPAHSHFSLSFAGEAYFVVGLHPNASRAARRFERPALVFNAHDQFEQLRDEDRYEKIRAKIIARDVALAGTANPMLSRHGEISEARQYSGRAVGEDWVCPFSPPVLDTQRVR